MASIRRPHSPARAQHLLRHNHPFATASPPSSPLRHASSSSAAAPSSSPRKPGYPHPFLFFTRRPLPRFAAFFLLGSFIGLLHLLSHLPLHHSLPAHSSPSHLTHLQQQQQQQEQEQPMTQQQQQYLADDAAGGGEEDNANKLLIVVTPTRARASQAYYLSRMGQTLRLVRPPVLWVVVEAGKPTPEAALALRRTAVMHRYVGCCGGLNASASPAVDFRPHQLNAGLEVVENHRLDGVVYFADEEGVYSLPLFDRLRQISQSQESRSGRIFQWVEKAPRPPRRPPLGDSGGGASPRAWPPLPCFPSPRRRPMASAGQSPSGSGGGGALASRGGSSSSGGSCDGRRRGAPPRVSLGPGDGGRTAVADAVEVLHPSNGLRWEACGPAGCVAGGGRRGRARSARLGRLGARWMVLGTGGWWWLLRQCGRRGGRAWWRSG